MEIEFTVKMDVSEQYATMLDRMNVGGSLGHFRNVIQVALNEVKDEFPDIIGAVFVDGTDNSGEGGHAFRTPPRPPVGREFGDRGVVVASAPRAERSDGMGPAKRPGIRTGRPATLHDHFASDGQPVRAAGPRSVETLVSEGVRVYRMVDGKKTRINADGSVWESADRGSANPNRPGFSDGTPNLKIQGKAQSTKNDRPPVITKRRGQS